MWLATLLVFLVGGAGTATAAAAEAACDDCGAFERRGAPHGRGGFGVQLGAPQAPSLAAGALKAKAGLDREASKLGISGCGACTSSGLLGGGTDCNGNWSWPGVHLQAPLVYGTAYDPNAALFCMPWRGRLGTRRTSGSTQSWLASIGHVLALWRRFFLGLFMVVKGQSGRRADWIAGCLLYLFMGQAFFGVMDWRWG